MCKNPYTNAEVEELRDLPSMSPEQFARVACISPRTVRNMCTRGELKAVRVARKWRINTRAALEFLGL